MNSFKPIGITLQGNDIGTATDSDLLLAISVATLQMLRWAKELVRDREWVEARRTVACLGTLWGAEAVKPVLTAMSNEQTGRALEAVAKLHAALT